MEIGLHIQQDGFHYEEIREITIEAEKKGLNSIWVLDHFHASPKPDEQQMLECWTLLSALASETKTIRLGVLVLNINNRLPAVVAKMATTLDMISRGRLDFGVGAGGTIRAERQRDFGYENEFDAYGIDFPKNPSIRIKKLDEGLEIIKRMWTQDTATFNGKHYSIRKAICFPKPVQKPHPPIWIGSRGGPKMMRVVAKHADGWNIGGINTVRAYRKMKKTLLRFCVKIGRSAREVKTSLNINILDEEFDEKMRALDHEGLDLAILRLPKGRETEIIDKM